MGGLGGFKSSGWMIGQRSISPPRNLYRWLQQWRSGKHICFQSDSMLVVAILNSRTAKACLLMHLLQCFSFNCAYFRFHCSTKHIAWPINIATEALSRINLSLFSSLILPTPRCGLPLALSQLLITTRPDWGHPHGHSCSHTF